MNTNPDRSNRWLKLLTIPYELRVWRVRKFLVSRFRYASTMKTLCLTLAREQIKIHIRVPKFQTATFVLNTHDIPLMAIFLGQITGRDQNWPPKGQQWRDYHSDSLGIYILLCAKHRHQQSVVVTCAGTDIERPPKKFFFFFFRDKNGAMYCQGKFQKVTLF